MSESKLVSTFTPKTQDSKSGEQPQAKDAYRAPRLVVLGTAVELVQSGAVGRQYDGLRGLWL